MADSDKAKSSPEKSSSDKSGSDKSKSSPEEKTIALLEEIRDLSKAQYETQKQFLFVLLPIFALMTIVTILGLTGGF